MLASAEARRNNALREIDRHRDAAGAAVRQAIDEVEDVEFRDVETGEVSWRACVLTTIRQRRANRANAKASTGPKTKAGKARSAQNALRHGLTISVWSEPALAPQAEAIALKIAGPNAEAKALEWARRIAEAQVDLDRVRSLCEEQAIVRMMSDPRCDSPLGDMQTVRLIRSVS